MAQTQQVEWNQKLDNLNRFPISSSQDLVGLKKKVRFSVKITQVENGL